MAKKSKAKKAKAKKATFTQAMQALQATGVPTEEFGRLNKDGTVEIDPNGLQALKKKLAPKVWAKVRFVALNAPFKRRSQIPTT